MEVTLRAPVGIEQVVEVVITCVLVSPPCYLSGTSGSSLELAQELGPQLIAIARSHVLRFLNDDEESWPDRLLILEV
jgi:hypothetical protein